MRTRIVRIGNSQGIRIPKPLLEQCGMTDEVELEVGPDHIVIRAVAGAREGWSEAFAEMAEAGDDELLDAETASSWDESEWTW